MNICLYSESNKYIVVIWYCELPVYKFVGSLEDTPRVRARRFVAAFLLHITHGLRSGAVKPRLRATKNRSRRLQAAVFVRFFSATFFAPLETLARFLYRGAKTPQTFLLYGICRDFFFA
jgi:hypothetical protein